MSGAATSPRARRWRGPLGLLALLALVAGAHLWFRAAGPPGEPWGDELAYLQHARRDARLGETSLLPGRLPFRTQPELAARVLARLDLEEDPLRAVAPLHVALLCLLLALTYGQARLLGVGAGGALVAALLLGLFPWLGFHVHSLWPEVPHAFLLGCVLWCLLLAVQHDRLAPLVPAGIAAALALLTKGVLQAFLPLFALVVGLAFFRHGRASDHEGAWPRALLAPALFLGALFAVLAPQLAANRRAGHGLRLAANRWWNLELGLTAERGTERSVNRTSQEYFAASPLDAERERLARERTLRYVRERGVLAVFVSQAQKLPELLFRRESSFERSLERMERWGPEPPAWLAALRLPARVLWYALLAAGLAGVAVFRCRSPGWTLVASFTLAFFVAVAAVPLKARFLLPVVPVLCLYAGALLDRLAAGRGARGEPGPGGAR